MYYLYYLLCVVPRYVGLLIINTQAGKCPTGSFSSERFFAFPLPYLPPRYSFHGIVILLSARRHHQVRSAHAAGHRASSPGIIIIIIILLPHVPLLLFLVLRAACGVYSTIISQVLAYSLQRTTLVATSLLLFFPFSLVNKRPSNRCPGIHILNRPAGLKRHHG